MSVSPPSVASGASGAPGASGDPSDAGSAATAGSPGPLRAPDADAERQALGRFASLLDRAESLRLRALPFDELRDLARLYRLHGARLARLRERGSDPDAVRHLNALCVRAYAFLYSAGPGREAPRPSGWRRGPALLARTARVQALAWALLALGVLVGGALVARDPAALYALVPAGMGYGPERVDALWSSADARERFLEREEAHLGRNALFGSSLFTHNTRVGLLSFATGVLAGIPTALLQLYNGLVLGALGAVFFRDPWPVEFAAWVLPHAVPELTAICLCAAGGLVWGAAVVAPGRRSRRRALREAAPPALALLAASLPLFAVAAFVESFVRESALGTAPRLAVAGGLAGVLVAAAALVRHLAREAPPESGWLAELEGAPLRSAPRSAGPGSGSALPP